MESFIIPMHILHEGGTFAISMYMYAKTEHVLYYICDTKGSVMDFVFFVKICSLFCISVSGCKSPSVFGKTIFRHH